MKENKSSILLVEENHTAREIITFCLESSFNFKVLETNTIDGIKNILKEKNPSMLICGSSTGPKEMKIEIFHFLVDTYPHIPFISFDETLDAYKNKSVDAVISKNNSIDELGQFIKNRFSIDENKGKTDYTEVTFRTLKYFENLAQDTYLQLKSGRFIKLFQKGDQINDEDIEKYQKKGVESLFINKETYFWILKEIKVAMPDILEGKKDKITLPPREDDLSEIKEPVAESSDAPKVAPKQVKDTDPNNPIDAAEIPQEMKELLNQVNVDKELLGNVHKNSQKIQQKFKQNKNLKKYFQTLLDNTDNSNFIKKRIDLICMIGCSMAKELQWASESSYNKIIYLAHIHDMILFHNVELCKINTLEEFEARKDEFSERDQKLYLQHPTIIAEIVKKDPEAPQEAAQIILQHHEMPEKNGFPSKIQTQRFLPFGVLLIVAIDFSQYMIGNPNWDINSYVEMAKNKYKGIIFTKVIMSLKKFLGK